MAIGSMLRPRWLPEKSFPPYAYLPGRQPHPVRLILLSAAGVKIREGKHAAAVRHARRAAALLRRLMKVPELAFERMLGMSPAALAEFAETAAKTHTALQATAPGQPQPVFNFILGSNSHGRPSGQVSRRLL
jgi:Xaa-Pro aminopeptidase